MNSAFYQNKEYAYSELGIVLEPFNYKTQKGKFFIPSIIPELDSSRPYTKTIPKASTSHIINYSAKHGVQGTTKSNFVELKIPNYIGAELRHIDIPELIVAKGEKVIITFIGGELSKPKVIGVYDQ